MSEPAERTYEARALAIHYFNWGGLPFVDRQSALAVVVDAEDEIGRLREQLTAAVALLREFGSCDPYSGQPYDEVTEFLAGLDA